MQRICSIIVMIVFLSVFEKVAFASHFAVDYRSDVIDYDDTSREFFRQRALYDFSENTYCHLTMIRTADDGDYYTWGFSISSPENNSVFYIGNFTAHFGAGLFLGRKNYFSPDPFSAGYRSSTDRIFRASCSGNPLYSFQGIYTGASIDLGEIKFSLNGFHSRRKRYASDSEEEALPTGVKYRYNENEKYRSPVYLSDTAILIAVNLCDFFSAQAYSLFSGIENETTEDLQWNPSGSVDYFLRKYGIAGLCLQYRDSYLSSFLETGVSIKRSVSDSDEESAANSYAFAGGIKLKSRFFDMNFTAKKTGERYLGLYSAGAVYPEDSVFMDSCIHVTDVLSFNAGSSMNRASGYSLSGSEYRFIRKEFAGMEMKKDRSQFAAGAKWINGSNGYSLYKSVQLKTRFQHAFKKLYLRPRGTYQRKHSENGWALLLEGGGGIWDGFKIKGQGGYCCAGTKNPLYLSFPAGASLNRGFFQREAAGMVSASITVKIKSFLLEAGGCSVFNNRCFLRNRIQFLSQYSF